MIRVWLMISVLTHLVYLTVGMRYYIGFLKHIFVPFFRYFVFFFDLVIFVNAIFIALDNDLGEVAFLVIFNMEIVLKIYTFGFKEFFARFWNL